MVPQVQVVSILMIVNGSLVSLMGLVLSVMGPTMFAIVSLDKGGRGLRREEEPVLAIISAIYLVLGLLVLIAGILNIVGGARGLRFRGRGLALTALFCNIVPLFTCYCLPTSLGIMIYGLIVYFQADVARAFKMGDEGVPVEEIREHFAQGSYRSRLRFRDDEEDEDYER